MVPGVGYMVQFLRMLRMRIILISVARGSTVFDGMIFISIGIGMCCYLWGKHPREGQCLVRAGTRLTPCIIGNVFECSNALMLQFNGCTSPNEDAYFQYILKFERERCSTIELFKVNILPRKLHRFSQMRLQRCDYSGTFGKVHRHTGFNHGECFRDALCAYLSFILEEGCQYFPIFLPVIDWNAADDIVAILVII